MFSLFENNFIVLLLTLYVIEQIYMVEREWVFKLYEHTNHNQKTLFGAIWKQ